MSVRVSFEEKESRVLALALTLALFLYPERTEVANFLRNGAQPREIGRTKSIHYSSMNLRVMTLVAGMGIQTFVQYRKYHL
jgi:hypothetical protein